ncbi:flavohemoglobin expression-modulating QEGLA motif protein [Spongiibacter sp. KMU-158]|uniref:Flavohemoglobin expression-modulating QEGLA motif protein n=1 Tax=Spongiibacter pelagi TaxID=2760804 RepID=A0A927GWS9_9GAMM|nr:flavohemoglobin expression-modulating QEGLA motif protein [Spongiibacter pelagi]MBD2858724.1 flavohemoglobin expression-modulating QEGLA motif protein [Spongiibacter pelagi]
MSISEQYKTSLRELSDELIAIQKPILILDAIKWPQEYENRFLANSGKRLPDIDAAFYQAKNPLAFDPKTKREELISLRHKIEKRLGKHDALAKMLCDTTAQYEVVIDMLTQRGHRGFMDASRQLYGSAREHLRGDKLTLIEMGQRLCEIFSLPAAGHLSAHYSVDIPATEAVKQLQDRLQHFFHDSNFTVRETDGIVSDAAAGGDCIKVNTHASFSSLDIRVLEVHEGWVHVGTTLNGRNQPWATWLSVGSPRITALQEGLAVLIETLTFSSYPGRARKISDRVVAIDMAEQGADFIEVYRHFVEQGLTPKQSYKIAQRVFRGGDVSGGSCFTKDLSYVKGFVETVNFIRSTILSDLPQLLPLLFVGKIALDDLPALYEYQQLGVIAPPRYLPPMFQDLNGLYVWFGFSSGMSAVNLESIQQHFKVLFQHLKV